MGSESLSVVVVFGLVLLLGLIYVVMGFVTGTFRHYERVDRQGDSLLLGKSIMNFAVWSIEPFARWLSRRSVTPNQITLSSILFGLLAAACIATGHFGYGFSMALLSGVADMLDGMLARFTGKTDRSGVVLDSTVDRYVDFFLLAGCALYFRDDVLTLGVCLMAILGSFMISYSTAKAEAMAVEVPRGAMKRTERYVYLLLGLAASGIWPTLWLLEQSPIWLVLWLLAILSNWSAVNRFRALYRAAKGEH
ncbi:CDP-alcohol phosphatidyltransferase family protein [Porticoccus sp.]